jgi:hypothetical protein
MTTSVSTPGSTVWKESFFSLGENDRNRCKILPGSPAVNLPYLFRPNFREIPAAPEQRSVTMDNNSEFTLTTGRNLRPSRSSWSI